MTPGDSRFSDRTLFPRRSNPLRSDFFPSSHPDARPFGKLETVTVEILGVAVERRHVYRALDYDGSRLVIEESAAAGDAPFGAPGNERSISVHHPYREGDPAEPPPTRLQGRREAGKVEKAIS